MNSESSNHRGLSDLTTQEFDLVVIGGGIYGVWTALEAVIRGMRVALIEKVDFGHATSANSLRIAHGGLRYLQHMDLRRMRQSIAERSRLIQIAPDIVMPIPFVLPTTGHGLRSRLVLAAAMRIADLIGIDRNSDLPAESNIPHGYTVGRNRARELMPFMQQSDVSGAAVWYDAQIMHPERLVMGILRTAEAQGLFARNYVSATELLSVNGRISGVSIRDELSGEKGQLDCRAVVNAAGPWVDDVLKHDSTDKGTPIFYPSKGFNLLVDRKFSDMAIGVPIATRSRDRDAIIHKGSETYFIVPWGKYSLIGTRHSKFKGNPEELTTSADEVEVFLQEVNGATTRLNLGLHNVVHVFSGLLPESASATEADGVQLQKHSQIIDHGMSGSLAGAYSLVGVKWTTARLLAYRAVRCVCEFLGITLSEGKRSSGLSILATKLHPASAHGSATSALPAEILRRYGRSSEEIQDICVKSPEMTDVINTDPLTMKAELVYLARHEHITKLSDAIFRRTDLWTCIADSPDLIGTCAFIIGDELKWSKSKRNFEVEDVRIQLKQRSIFRRQECR